MDTTIYDLSDTSFFFKMRATFLNSALRYMLSPVSASSCAAFSAASCAASASGSRISKNLTPLPNASISVFTKSFIYSLECEKSRIRSISTPVQLPIQFSGEKSGEHLSPFTRRPAAELDTSRRPLSM